MTYFKFIYMAIFTLYCFPSQAQFIDRKAEGWHFYEELNKKRSQKKKKDSHSQTPVQEDPLEKTKQYKENLDRLRALAVMEPTFKNVQTYMVAQKEMLTKAGKFAKKWMEVLYTTPSLDYSIKHPTSQIARHVYLDEQKLKMEREVKKLSKSHGLFFFVSSSCAYCRNFAPIVRAFSQKYGWDVIAISTDGSTLPDFPRTMVDNGISQKLGVKVLPTLLAVNPNSEEVIPLSFGMTSQEQILDRIRVLIIERKRP